MSAAAVAHIPQSLPDIFPDILYLTMPFSLLPGSKILAVLVPLPDMCGHFSMPLHYLSLCPAKSAILLHFVSVNSPPLLFCALPPGISCAGSKGCLPVSANKLPDSSLSQSLPESALAFVSLFLLAG